jgi:hypothetical protein
MYTPAILPGFLIGLLAGTITFTWIFNSTGGSVLMTILWHGTYNYATACTLCKTGANAAVVSTLVMVWAVLIVILYAPTKLSSSTKIISPEAPDKLSSHSDGLSKLSVEELTAGGRA